MIANSQHDPFSRPHHKIVDRTKIRDGAVANRPIYVAEAVTAEGRRGILGLWAGDGGEGAKHWVHILTEIKNRGVGDVLMLVRDGLKGLPDAVETIWPATIVQTCVVNLLRNSFRYAARPASPFSKQLSGCCLDVTGANTRPIQQLGRGAGTWHLPNSQVGEAYPRQAGAQ
jgi:hypothetical protein